MKPIELSESDLVKVIIRALQFYVEHLENPAKIGKETAPEDVNKSG